MAQADKKAREQMARKRAVLIMKVRSGAMSVEQAAKELGVSRKTYYAWEGRAFRAMMEAIETQPSGRPAKSPDRAKASLEERVRQLEQALLVAEKRLELKEWMRPLGEDLGLKESKPLPRPKKNSTQRGKGPQSA